MPMKNSGIASRALGDEQQNVVVGSMPKRLRFGALGDCICAALALAGGLFCLLLAIEAKLVHIDPTEDRAVANHVLAAAVGDLNRKSYEKLAAMGNESRAVGWEEGWTPYRVDFEVSRAKLGLLEIRAVLKHRATGKEVERIVTYRAK